MTTMRVFISVIQDLGIFLWTSLVHRQAQGATVKPLALPEALPSIAVTGRSALLGHPLPVFAKTKVGTEAVAPPGTYTSGFIVAAEALIYVRPVVAFDEVLVRLAYGTALRVLRHEGRFSYVETATTTGWAKKDDITVTQGMIIPECQVDVFYHARHDDTCAVRRYLRDDFGASELCLPLQAVEYVSYRLKLAGIEIPWPLVRPRLPGTWHNLLRGERLIHCGIDPQTGAILEWRDAAGDGQLGYVEAVHPDGTILVALVGFSAEGVFLRREFSRVEYRALGGVFIASA